MKRILILFLILTAFSVRAAAEPSEDMLGRMPADEMRKLTEISGVSFEQLVKDLLSGNWPEPGQWGERVVEALREAAARRGGSALTVLLCACLCSAAKAVAGMDRTAACAAMDLLCAVASAALLLGSAAQSLGILEDWLIRLRAYSSAVTPVLAAALSVSGSPSMASAMAPSAALMDGMTLFVSAQFGLPMLRCSLILAVCAGLGEFRLERLFKLFVSVQKWVLGACMTAFLALMGAKKTVLGGYDSATVQAARYAADNLLPIVGGELSDTAGSVLAGAMVLRNAVGVAVSAGLLTMLLSPAVELAAGILTGRLLAACLEALSCSGIAEMADRYTQALELMLALLSVCAALTIILAGAATFTLGAGL